LKSPKGKWPNLYRDKSRTQLNVITDRLFLIRHSLWYSSKPSRMGVARCHWNNKIKKPCNNLNSAAIHLIIVLQWWLMGSHLTKEDLLQTSVDIHTYTKLKLFKRGKVLDLARALNQKSLFLIQL
jgi:hypothetical protein